MPIDQVERRMGGANREHAMSRQNAELSEDFASTDSRLDAILAQLNALGQPGLEPPAPEVPSSRPESVPPAESAPPESSTLETPEPSMPMPMPAEQPSRPLQSVPDLESSLQTKEPVLDETPAPDGVLQPPEAPLPPPMLGLVPPPIEPPLDEPPPVPSGLLDEVEPEPVVVEYRSPETHAESPTFEAPSEPAPVEITMAKESPQVFVLDGPLETDTIAPFAPPPVPVIDSEFGPVVEADADTSAGPEFDSEDDADPGWVSYHTAESTVPEIESTVPEIESTVPEEVSMDHDFASLMQEPEATFAAESEAEEDEAEPTFGAPEWSDVVEEIVEPESELHAGLELEPELEMFTLEDDIVDTPAVEHHFDCDEDLPIPDFTGVWVDSEDPSVWDKDVSAERLLPGPVEGGRNRNGNGISVGRNELDNLRPVEEEVVVKEAPNLGRKLQLVGVVLFGLIALAVMFLNDPAVVDELRALYDGFFN